MCGILFARLKSEFKRDKFERIFSNALSLMRYRGPDSFGILKYKNNYFGHVRLSIIDLSDSSYQPMEDNENILLFNGEIYNFKDLDKSSKSDTKVIFNYLKTNKGSDIDFQGMFALLYYNKLEDNIRIYRDSFGEKPLYYFENDTILIVSSTIKSLIYVVENFLEIKLKLNISAINDYLLFGFVREPNTIYKDIFTIQTGTCTIISNNNEFLIQQLKIKSVNSEKYLLDSIISTDVKPILLLSSGVDSSYILGQAIKNKLNPNIYIYKSQDPSENESERAYENLEVIVKFSDIAIDSYIVENTLEFKKLYGKFISIIEQPSNHGLQFINIFEGIKSIQPRAKLILTGLGGDELFGGYNSFRYLSKYKLIKKLPFVKIFRFGKFAKFFSLRFSNKSNFIKEYYYKYRLDVNGINYLLNEDLNSNFVRFSDNVLLSKCVSDIVNLKECEIQDYMKNQLLRDIDNISMYYGLEARSPILSNYRFLNDEVGRKTFKNFLKETFRIKFGVKTRGFTLDEDKVQSLKFFNNEIIRLNKFYNLFDIDNIINLNSFNYSKKIYILLAWLEFNKILQNQIE